MGLELPSIRGDQTLGEVRFVLHGSSETAGRGIIERGLNFTEGRATVSTSLIQAYGYATDPVKRGYSLSSIATTGDPGLITVVAVPNALHLGYAAFTTAYIDRRAKLVNGAPLRYAGARKQLAFYLDADTEATRRKVEGKVRGGTPLAEQSLFDIEPRFIVGSYKPTPGLHQILTGIEVSAKAFEALDATPIERTLAELFEYREPAQAVLVPSMVRAILVGTIEAVVMSRMRMMRWQGLALLGYKFQEGDEDVAIAGVADSDEQKRRIAECESRLEGANIFTGELAWLKEYVRHELDLMRVEVDGDTLEKA